MARRKGNKAKARITAPSTTFSAPQATLAPLYQKASRGSLNQEEQITMAQRSPKVKRYGATESKDRLDREGFHPQVTNRSVPQIHLTWLLFAQRMMDKPTRDEYVSGFKGYNGVAHSVSRQLTRAPLIFRPEFLGEDFGEQSVRGQNEPNGLINILESPHVGGQIVELVFSDGLKTAQSLALTCTRVWRILGEASNIWDFHAAQFRTQGHNGVFAVTAPEYTIGELLRARVEDPLGTDPNNFVSGWSRAALSHDEIVSDMLILLSLRKLDLSQAASDSSKASKISAPLIKSTFEQRVLDMLGQLKSIKDVFKSSQFTIKNGLQLFEAQPGQALRCFQQLLTQINSHRGAIKVLSFYKTPLLDCRVLAVILRACPKVTMLGIYNCPLIHFGDVVCILDLIWEINKERRASSLPTIQSFDFFPRYHNGMPYQDDRGTGYGLTWGPQKMEVVQRGFFLLILKAFMKSKVMKLDLIFSKNHAFVNYLRSVPNPPLAVPSFLDALYRFMDLHPKKTMDYENEFKRVIYDMLKQVRIGLERPDADFPKYYLHIMGSHLHFCSSCGYEMFEEFFTAEARTTRPHRRVCSGCTLQRYLDQETDHMKMELKDVLTCLFPNWNEAEFNLDAPIPSKGIKIINLKTACCIRPRPPSLQVLPNGLLHEPQYLEPLVRDNKVHSDSLQNLPSLDELVGGGHIEHWHNANRKCANLEMYRKCLYLLQQQKGDKRPGPPFFEDDIDECQFRNVHVHSIQSYNFPRAVQFYAALRKTGW